MSILSIMLPIFFVFLIGYTAQRILALDTGTISKFALYILMPFLVFRTFYENTIKFSDVYLIIYLLGICMGIILLVSVIALLLNYSKEETSGLILSSAFMNNGNYGTPLILLLFGEQGMNIAIVIMVIQQLLMTTLGVFIAAKGSEYQGGGIASIKAVIKMPMVYAAITGIILNTSEISIGVMNTGVDLIADAAIPAVMVTLGMHLANITIRNIHWDKLMIALVLKLAVSPFIALLIVMILPVDDLTKQIMMILAATPTAANTTLYAIQFQTDSQNVSAVTLFSTILSLITIPVVIFLVNG